MDLSVRVWDCDSFACLHKLAGGGGGGHTKEVVGVSTSRDGSSTVVSAGYTLNPKALSVSLFLCDSLSRSFARALSLNLNPKPQTPNPKPYP